MLNIETSALASIGGVFVGNHLGNHQLGQFEPDAGFVLDVLDVLEVLEGIEGRKLCKNIT